MRRLILIIIALATLLPSLAQAYDVLVLQSRRDPGYEEALKGFRAGNSISQRLVVLSDYAEVDVVRIVREDRPAMVLAIGDAALAAVGKIRTTPVIAIMSLDFTPRSNLTGVTMFASPDRYCHLLKQMKSKRIGIIHNPNKTGHYLQQARNAALAVGIELVVREVTTSRETVSQLDSLAGKVDALWMLPDTTAVTRDTAEAYFRFAKQHDIPVVSFAPGYLGLGAAAVVEIDFYGLGRQAADKANRILAGNNEISASVPNSTRIKTNPIVLNRLGLVGSLTE